MKLLEHPLRCISLCDGSLEEWRSGDLVEGVPLPSASPHCSCGDKE